LSNDATAVVLTPAVYAAARAAGATPLPYLSVCAFIANAASFVLPISNPANLVIFNGHMPPLAAWLGQFALPSIVSIGVTYLALLMTQRRALEQEKIAHEVSRPRLNHGGRLTAYGIGMIAVVLLCCSALDVQLGLPTFICGVVTAGVVLALNRGSPLPLIRGVSWGVLPLVAGLFVLVEALEHTGVIAALSRMLRYADASSIMGATWGAGITVGVASNPMNNLPVGLIGGSVVIA
jgi:arsenical pump membrane protein